MNQFIYILTIFLFLFFSCTKEINVTVPNSGSQFVVNGIIENGEVPRVLLQRTLPYFEPVYLNSLIDNSIIQSLVNDATVTITNGYGQTDTLMALGYVGFTDTWFHNYVGTGNMKGEEGVSYKLKIIKEDTVLSAIASVPKLAPITKDSLRFIFRADDSSYCYMLGNLIDPDTMGNCYRMFSKTKSIWGSDFDNNQDGYDDLYISMLDQDGNYNDEYVNGWDFSFPMYKGRGFWQEWGQQDTEENIEVDGNSGATTGFWNIGDSVILKWSSVDRASWDFWVSLQYNNPGGPFGAPSQVNTNINGGLGVFGGNSSEKIHLIANPNIQQKIN